MLEEWEKTGPRILKSLAGIPAWRMMAFFSHSTSSDRPERSNLIHNRVPPVFFLAFGNAVPAAAAAMRRLLAASSGALGGCGGDGGGGAAAFLGRRREVERRKEKGPLPMIND